MVELVERGSTHDRSPGHRAEPVRTMLAAILVGGYTELLVSWLDGRLDISRQQLVADSTALFLGLRDTAGTLAASRR
jgi:hypothetical protein